MPAVDVACTITHAVAFKSTARQKHCHTAVLLYTQQLAMLHSVNTVLHVLVLKTKQCNLLSSSGVGNANCSYPNAHL